jgi:hypothetical protein
VLLLNIIPWIVLIILVFLIYKKFKKSKNIENPIVEGKDISEINSQKHGCKCYMEGLNGGEREVAHILSEGLDYKDYYIFNNLTIPSDNNGSSQIDHLVVSRFGIFVIESKDYKGWIFGNKDQDDWTQSLPGGKNKFNFQNPIHQNWSHIMSLRSLMPIIPEKDFYSIVVFTGDCEIKTDSIENVVYADDLIKSIKRYKEDRLSLDNIHSVIGKLSYVCQTVDIPLSQHIDNLQSHHIG